MGWVVFDIDGTIADCAHRVHLAQTKDWEAFHSLASEDKVIDPVASLMVQLGLYHDILLLTGRPEKYRKLTLEWLEASELWDFYDKLLMRPDSDYGQDSAMKIRLLEEMFGSKEKVLENVWFVVDDRDQVVEALRNYGLTVLQPCAGGY